MTRVAIWQTASLKCWGCFPSSPCCNSVPAKGVNNADMALAWTSSWTHKRVDCDLRWYDAVILKHGLCLCRSFVICLFCYIDHVVTGPDKTNFLWQTHQNQKCIKENKPSAMKHKRKVTHIIYLNVHGAIGQSHISHNASDIYPTMHHFCNRNVHTCAHFCYKTVYCGIYWTGALWDMWYWSINPHIAGNAWMRT